jgi:hypothetical protein
MSRHWAHCSAGYRNKPDGSELLLLQGARFSGMFARRHLQAGRLQVAQDHGKYLRDVHPSELLSRARAEINGARCAETIFIPLTQRRLTHGAKRR